MAIVYVKKAAHHMEARKQREEEERLGVCHNTLRMHLSVMCTSFH
jgi:hypothetical protein